MSRTLLDEPIVMYRQKDGKPVALRDECPHRFVPLSHGELIDNNVQCGYHGLRFDRYGQCNDIPTQSHIPKSACVKSYPIVECHNLVWLWFGDSDLADETLIPDWTIESGLAHDTDSAWASCQDYYKPQANYSLVIDNLLDLSHVVFVHGSTFGSDGLNDAEVSSSVEENRISDRRQALNCNPGPAFVGCVGDENTEVDAWMDMHWLAPSNLLLEFGVTAPGRPRNEGYQWIASHLLTPETQNSTHYFWVVSRAFDLSNEQLTKFWHDAVYGAFQEDDEILAKQQQLLGKQDLFSYKKPIALASDKSAMNARRIISRLLEEQVEESTTELKNVANAW